MEIASFVLTLMIICCVVILFFTYDAIMRKSCDNIYTEINGDDDTLAAKKYIQRTSYKCQKDPIDYYRVGNLYDFIMHDTKMANNYYIKAIDQIKKNPQDKQTNFIQNRLRDRISINFMAEEDDNKYNFEELTELEDEVQNLEILIEQNIRTSGGAKSKLEKKITWESDSQNVHDSAITEKIKKDFDHIYEHNIQNRNYIWNYDDMILNLQNNAKHEINPLDVKNIPGAIKTLQYIKKYNPNIVKLNK